MIESFYYSIANKKVNSTITSLVEDLIALPYTPKKDVRILKHVLEVAEKGQYPSKQYFATFYDEPAYRTNNLAEIQEYVGKCKDFFKKEFLGQEVLKAVNDSNTAIELEQSLSKVLSSSDEASASDEFDEFKPVTYTQNDEKPHAEGIKCGIQEVDEITNGFQRGTLASVGAFTGHGKSTELLSMMFENALAGKKNAFFSLELAKELIWSELEARYMAEVKGMDVTTTDFIQHRLTTEKAAEVKKYEDDFQSELASNIMVLDESVLSKTVVCDYKQIMRLFEKVQVSLGGLDITYWDHAHQLELLYKDCGNIAIRNITSATKVWLNKDGVHPVSVLAVQTNREGEKRARKRQGLYDLQAIADLNECASAHTTIYVDGKSSSFGSLVRSKNDHYVESVDYATGRLVKSKVVDKFVSGKTLKGEIWYNLEYDFAPKEMLFTPSHRILVNGNKVKLKDLPNEFLADYVDWVVPEVAEQVLIGTLLGDSCISLSEGQTKVKDAYSYTVRLLQGHDQLEYLKWKCSVLGDLINSPKKQGNRNVYCACSKSTRSLGLYKGLTNKPYKEITDYVWSKFGKYSLLTWFLDDGCLVRDSKNSYHIVIACTNFGEENAKMMQRVLLERFGIRAKLNVKDDKRSSKKQLYIVAGAESSRIMMSIISPLLNLDCINYKLDHENYPVVEKDVIQSPFIGVIKKGLKVRKTEVVQKSTYKNKYNFTVSNQDHNYVLPGGLVSSNCERSSTYVVTLYTPDESKIIQETKVCMIKDRLGPVLVEPAVVTFLPQLITVGTQVESMQSEGNFDSLGTSFDDNSSFDSFNGDDDDFGDF